MYYFALKISTRSLSRSTPPPPLVFSFLHLGEDSQRVSRIYEANLAPPQQYGMNEQHSTGSDFDGLEGKVDAKCQNSIKKSLLLCRICTRIALNYTLENYTIFCLACRGWEILLDVQWGIMAVDPKMILHEMTRRLMIGNLEWRLVFGKFSKYCFSDLIIPSRVDKKITFQFLHFAT